MTPASEVVSTGLFQTYSDRPTMMALSGTSLMASTLLRVQTDWGFEMTAQLDDIIGELRQHVQALRDSRDDVTGYIIVSRQMIARSYTLLRLGDKIQAEQGRKSGSRGTVALKRLSAGVSRG